MTGPLLPAAAAVPLAFVFGALIGSFLNVVVWRVPQGLSIVRPPSACPSCGHEIAWYDNIPIVSWLVLRARCRSCGAHISVRYPLVEAGTGLAFALVVGAPYLGIYPFAVLPAILYWAAVGIALTLMPTHVFFYSCAVFCVVCAVICWVRYAKPGAKRPG